MAKAAFWKHLGWRVEAGFYDLAEGLARLAPVDLVSDVGAWLAATIGPRTRLDRVAETNLRIAFPDLGDAEIDSLRRSQWRDAGRWAAEFMIVDRLVADPSRVEIVGGEQLKAIAREARPVVFVTGHFANFEIMAWAIIACGVNCQITYRAANNPYFDERVRRARARYGVSLFAPKGLAGGRELMRALARGESVALMNDQKFNDGIAAPLFGTPAFTAHGPTTLALRFGIPMVPISVQRRDRARFTVIFHDPIQLQPTGDRAADLEAGVRQVNAFVEARVRERPTQWLWVHKRWPDQHYRRAGAR